MKKFLLLIFIPSLIATGMVGYGLGIEKRIDYYEERLAYYEASWAGAREWLHSELQRIEHAYIRNQGR